MLSRILEGSTILALISMVYADALVGSLIFFVLFSLLVCRRTIYTYKRPYLGIAYLLIYTGAIAVLFVLVLLLADSRQVGLAAAYLLSTSHASHLGWLLCFLTITGVGLAARGADPFSANHALGQSSEVVPSSLGSVAYGENLLSLSQTGLALLTSTLTALLTAGSL